MKACVVSMICVFAGCAITAQKVRIHPHVELAADSNAGVGHRVAIEAVDARPDKVIGFRGGVMKSGPITSTDDIAAAIAKAASAGLAKKGFAIVASGEADRILRIELQTLDYQVMQLPRSLGVAVNVSMKVIARAGGQVYEQSYTKEPLESVHASPPARYNEKLINRALSEAIGDLLGDERLVSFLAEARL